MSDFAKRLRELRLKYYWNQSQLAKRTGVSTSLISSYENSERFPSLDILIKLSDIFCCSTDYLLGLEYEQTLSLKGLSDQQILSLIHISHQRHRRHGSLPRDR